MIKVIWSGVAVLLRQVLLQWARRENGGKEERKKLMKQFSQNNGKTRGREEILEELLGQNTLDPK